ncbi:hypothetical protein D3C76_813580 [compost metagenome]
MHEDVAADVAKILGHLLTIGAQRTGQIQARVATAHRLRVGWIADQTDRCARHAQANGDFRAHRDELEVFAEHLVAQSRSLVTTVEAHLLTDQAGTDSDAGFARQVMSVHEQILKNIVQK